MYNLSNSFSNCYAQIKNKEKKQFKKLYISYCKLFKITKTLKF